MDSHRKEAIERVKKDVRSVLITQAGGMLLEDFLKFFRELTDSPLQYRRLGYQSAEELLLEATDVCRCQRLPTGQLHLRPVCDQSTSHVLKMVERSRRPKMSRAENALRQRGQRVPWLPGIQLEPELAPCPSGSVPVGVRDSVLKLLAHNPQGIHLDEFNQKHKNMFGHAITFIGFGFYSMKGMLESIPDLVRLKATPTGDKAFPIPAPGSGPSSGRVTDSGAAGDPPPPDAFLTYEDSVRGLNEKLLKALSAHKTAVKVSDVLNLYRRANGHHLDYQEYGFTSLLSALVSLGPPFHLEKRDDDWHVIVRRGARRPATDHGRPPTASSSSSEVPSSASEAPGSASESEPTPCVPREPGPPPLAGLPAPRFTLEPLGWLEHGRQVTTETGYPLLEVVITHAHSPGEFFFCLSGSAFELARLESELAAEYGGAAGRRLQPAESQLTVGLTLAVYHRSVWRRALLLGRVAEEVKVYLVDTGATLLLPLRAVRTLHDRFVELPALAHEGTLARVAPRHGAWTPVARALFDRITGGEVPLMATVLLQSDSVTSLLLCDTRGETDVHLGDLLVSARHAVVRQEDAPPAPLRTPRSRLLTDLGRLLPAPPAGEDRVPPEGAEPLSPASKPQVDTAQARTTGLDQQVAALKVQCYDTQKLCQGAPAGPRRAALNAKLQRLEAELEKLLSDVPPPNP